MNVFDQTAIENTLKTVLTSIFGTAYKIYPSRPTASVVTNDAFIVAKVSGSIIDRATYGECVCMIHLFAKDLSGVKNSKKLSKMYTTLINGLPRMSNDLIFDNAPVRIADTPDDYGYTARILKMSITIKATQN